MQEKKVLSGTGNEITYVTGGGVPITLTLENVQRDFAKEGTKISEYDFRTFANLCASNKLNPYNKEVWFVSTNGRAQIMIGKDGYFKMAESNPNYDGMQDGVIVSKKESDGKTGELLELEGCFVPSGYELLGGWAKVYSKDKKYPKVSKVSLKEYQGLSPLWKSKPAVMINKCAKTTALRDMFPQTFAGTYDESEISSDTGEIRTFNTKEAVKEKLAEVKPDLSFLNTVIHREGKPDLTIEQMVKAVKNLRQAAAVKDFLEKEVKNTERAEAERKAIEATLNGIEKGTVTFSIE